MEKIGLFALICVLALLLVGCTKNVKTTPVEDSSEVIFKNPEVQNNTPEPAKQDAKLSNAICNIEVYTPSQYAIYDYGEELE